MNAKQRAKQLVDRFNQIGMRETAKSAATIAVEEILHALLAMPYGLDYLQERDYFEQVKREIQNI